MTENSELQKLKEKQDKILRELWPIREPRNYDSEEALYSEGRELWQKFWDPPDPRYFDVMNSVVLLSHRLPQFSTVPYPFLWGPMNSGKSRALDLLHLFCRKSILVSNISPAAIYQAIDNWHPTLLIDETDKWGFSGKNGSNDQVLAITQVLNSGYRRGQKVLRASRENGQLIIYDTFGLKVIAGTEPLPPTLMDRCILLRMARNIHDIPLSIDPESELITRFQGQLQAYGEYHEKENYTCGLDLEPEWLKSQIGDNRVTELFIPLYGVCPSEEGRKNLLSLAQDIVEERRQNENSGELSEVVETVWGRWAAQKPDCLPISAITEFYLLSHVWTRKTDIRAWMGRRLAKLGFRQTRTNKERGILTPGDTMERLARVFARHLLSASPSQPSHPSLHEEISPSQSDGSDGSDGLREGKTGILSPDSLLYYEQPGKE